MKSITTLILACLLCSGPAVACRVSSKPYLDQVADFASRAGKNNVAFVGTVKPVEQNAFDGETHQRLTMEVKTWLRGGAGEATIVVRGYESRRPGQPCPPPTDRFLAGAGEQWLIFGWQMEGEVTPDNRLSRRSSDGSVAPQVLAALAAHGEQAAMGSCSFRAVPAGAPSAH